MTWNELLTQGLTAAGSGTGGFVGAFFNFKSRLKKAEEKIDAVITEAIVLAKTVAELKTNYEHLSSGWRLEFDSFKEDFERELRHNRELDELRENERSSRPDPMEQLHQDLRMIRAEVEKLKERGGRYVRGETFAQFMKQQEDQWKTIERTLGRLEGMLKV